ncbi:MAG: rane protein [Segetibacter sp.]|nr:rane protein [Segetibacter sp.]
MSCVSSKRLRTEQERYDQLNSSYAQSQREVEKYRSQNDELSVRKAQLEAMVESLNKQVALLRENNNTLSGISNTQAQSIKKSMENMGSTDAFIRELQRGIARKDSISMALVLNLKGALSDINDEDVNIQIDKSAVYISISDKLLFKSGSYEVSDRAHNVLGKVAQVLNSKPEIEFLVEGHTDNVPIKNNCIVDNWDLSTKRATAIVRILQNQYKIDPDRMTAGGRSEYIPLQANDTSTGRALNRRTRIVILPQLDQFLQLLDKKM